MSIITDMDIQPLKEGDSHYLLNIDLKGSEFPWEVEDWQLMQNYFPDWLINVAAIHRVPAAFSISEIDKEGDVHHIHKMVALPDMERYGLKSTLLDMLEYDAILEGVSFIEIVVSETQCRGPSDPYDVSEWLLAHGFKCEDVEKGTYEAYGEVFDGFLFKKPVIYGKFF